MEIHIKMVENHIKTVECLITEGRADVNKKNFIGNSAAHISALNDNVEMLKLLIKHKIDLLVQNDEKLTCLNHAEMTGRFKFVEFLSQCGHIDFQLLGSVATGRGC